MKFLCILAILLTANYIAAVASSAESCQCFHKLMDSLKAKGIITDERITVPGQQEEQCDPLTLARLSDMSRKKTISIKMPVDMLVDGNSVLVVARKKKAILRFDEDGNRIARYALPGREPKHLELHDNRLYVTTESKNRVMRSNDIREDGDLTFTDFLTLNYAPNGIKFTPDGKEFLIGSYKNKISVYNSETLKLIRKIETKQKKSKVIKFSADDTIYVTHDKNVVSTYSKDYELLKTLRFGSSKESFQGLVMQCDGSKILVSENGKIFFVNKDDKLIGSFKNPKVNYNTLRDMAITSGGSVFITDHFGNKLYIFQ